MIPEYLAPLVNHLWQSTLFAGVAGGLAFALRKNHAATRHWLWMAASVKFLVPFSLLVSLGSHLGWPPRRIVQNVSRVSIVMEGIGNPVDPFDFMTLPPRLGSFGSGGVRRLPSLPLAIWFVGCAAVLLSWSLRWRRVSAALRSAERIKSGREVKSLRRLERIAGIRRPIELLKSGSSLEPGIFGIARPVLLLPSGIGERVSDAQLEAILVHELCHVRRRDNLAAAIHMAVEAIFWFHPLVWWLGARMVEARERACDEEVLRLGSEPQVYAESILKICEFYLESPLACASGVTGADLKKRIEDIMTLRIARKLDLVRKLALAGFGIAAVAGPVVIGLLNAPQGRAQDGAATAKEFEVASIKPADPGARGVRIGIMPGGRFNASNVTVRQLIQQAYNLKDFQVTGGPSWINSERLEINAKADGALGQGPDAIRPLIQKLLADRFQLTFHKETKELPIYALVVGKGGIKLQETKDADNRTQIRMGRGQINGQAMPMTLLATQLSNQLGRIVIDRTDLKGNYEVKLEWTPEDGGPRGPGDGPDAPPPESSKPTIFTALQEQLGLKLEAQKGPVEILIIDRVEKATEN